MYPGVEPHNSQGATYTELFCVFLGVMNLHETGREILIPLGWHLLVARRRLLHLQPSKSIKMVSRTRPQLTAAIPEDLPYQTEACESEEFQQADSPMVPSQDRL